MGFFKELMEVLGLAKKKPSKYRSFASQVRVVEKGTHSGVERTMHFEFIPPKRQYIVKVDGVYSVFASKEEMPSDVRQSVESVENANEADKTFVIIVDGHKRTFHSVDDMPDDMRHAVKLAEKEADAK